MCQLLLVEEKPRHHHADRDEEAREESLLPPHVVGVEVLVADAPGRRFGAQGLLIIAGRAQGARLAVRA
jgi:hypothetical protein